MNQVKSKKRLQLEVRTGHGVSDDAATESDFAAHGTSLTDDDLELISGGASFGKTKSCGGGGPLS